MITAAQAEAIAELLRECERSHDPDRPLDAETLALLRADLRDFARDLLTLRRTTRPQPIWYLAHPVGPTAGVTVADNLARAKRWLRWLMANADGTAFCCPWLPMVEVLDDSVPANRARGLRDDIAIALTCDGIVLCGGRISAGMQAELDAMQAAGRAVLDLTALGDEPPAEGLAQAIAWNAATINPEPTP